MSTNAQIAANRSNAARSTGPRTPEGKARSSANALRHGLAGRFRVLDTESQADFDQLLALHLDEFNPATPYELFLVEQIVQSQWLVARAQRLEIEMIERMTADRNCTDADDMLIKAYRGDSARALTNLQRQAAAHQRAAFRAHDQLRAIRRDQVRDQVRDQARQPRETKPASPELASFCTEPAAPPPTELPTLVCAPNPTPPGSV